MTPRAACCVGPMEAGDEPTLAHDTINRVTHIWNQKGPLTIIKARQIFQVSVGASKADVMNAYKKLALMVHPDKCTHPKANDAFAAISGAKTALANLLDRSVPTGLGGRAASASGSQSSFNARPPPPQPRPQPMPPQARPAAAPRPPQPAARSARRSRARSRGRQP